MIAVAVSLNLGIALFCLCVTWRLWRLSRTLGAVADTLGNWEHSAQNMLDPAVVPPAILLGRSGTAQLRGQYAQLQRQLQRLQQLVALVSMLPLAGRWLGLGSRGRRFAPRSAIARAKKR